jgi:hypothetical protein
MASYGVGFGAVGFEAGGDVVVVEAFWVEPIFQGCAPAAVAEHAAVPDTFEGGKKSAYGHLVASEQY